MSEFKSKYVKCPFFRRLENNRICCEGTDDNNTINLVFGDTKKLEAYKERYCCRIEGYPRCLVCIALERKYWD